MNTLHFTATSPRETFVEAFSRAPLSAPTFISASCRRSPSAQPCRYKPSTASSRRNYDPNASIALVGIRGTGLSTLAVIAATALDFRLFDADQHFYHATGLSRVTYKSTHGAAQYRYKEMDLLRSMLLDNPSRAVIVCGPGAVEPSGQALVTQYARTHPVIYVTRDVQGIQHHLRVLDADKISSLTRLSAPILRSLSNFEFHNLSDMADPDSEVVHGSGHSSPRTLTLKQVEHDFLHLVQSMMRWDRRNVEQESPHRLSSVPVEARPFTYSLSLPVSVPDAFWADIRHVDIDADVVELVIPLSELGTSQPELDNSVASYITRQFSVVRRNIRLPIMIYLELDYSQSVTARLHMERYFDALHHSLRLAPEFLCVDISCNEDMVRRLVDVKGATRIVAHSFDTSSSPVGWGARDRRDKIHLAERLGADIVRLCQEATSIADNFAVRHFVDQAIVSKSYKIPIIAYNTGRLGQMSCYFNSILSPVTDPILQAHLTGPLPTSLLTTRQAQNALYSSLLLEPMYFGIYGNNVTQSFSPAMHNTAFQFSGMPHEYKIFQHSTIQELGRLFNDPHFGGVSITAPFKREVIPLVDFMSRESQAIGAVNTLIPLRAASINSLLDRNRAGRAAAVYGENTDWIGIHTCVRHNLSPINAVKRRTTALVVGAGGMARAATYALFRLGIRNIFIHNRTRKNADSLVEQFHGHLFTDAGSEMDSCPPHNSGNQVIPTSFLTIKVIDEKNDVWPAGTDFPTVIVSCVTTRDVNGQSSVDTSLSSNWLSSPTGGVVVELSYTPLETPLLKQIRSLDHQGWIAVDGLEILPEQGKMQFELFTSRGAPIKLMRREVVKAYKKRVNITAATIQSVLETAR